MSLKVLDPNRHKMQQDNGNNINSFHFGYNSVLLVLLMTPDYFLLSQVVKIKLPSSSNMCNMTKQSFHPKYPQLPVKKSANTAGMLAGF